VAGVPGLLLIAGGAGRVLVPALTVVGAAGAERRLDLGIVAAGGGAVEATSKMALYDAMFGRRTRSPTETWST
jgi:hypothetical protein